MPGLKGFVFKNWDPIGHVVAALENWSPTGFSTEKEAELSILDHFSAELEGLEVLNQFRYDRITADILIERTVAIELKLNLATTAEFQRLIGQLESYKQWGVRMIVLVVGDLDQDIANRIRSRLMADWGDEDGARLLHFPLQTGV